MIEDDCLQVGILRNLYWYLYGKREKEKKEKGEKRDSCRNGMRAESILLYVKSI